MRFILSRFLSCGVSKLFSLAVFHTAPQLTKRLEQAKRHIPVVFYGCFYLLNVSCHKLPFFFFSRRFLRSNRNFAHANLVLSLILAELLFVVGIDKTQYEVCSVVITNHIILVFIT